MVRPAMTAAPVPLVHKVLSALKDASGKAVGDVNLVQTSNGVLIRLSVKGLPAGQR